MMRDNYKRVKLGEVVYPVSQTYKFAPNEKVIFINTGDILEGKFLHSNLSDSRILPGQAKKRIKKGDILFSEIRPANKRYAFVDFDADNYVVSTKLMVLRPNDNIDSQYLYIWLTMPSTLQNFQIIAESRSGTFPQITFDSIKNEDLSLPPLSEQKRIANILSSFDNKIEQLKKENNILENIAQSIFKEWFVKYNFPNKDGKPYRDSGGKMIDSELGLIPEGWRVGKLGEILELKSGYPFSSKDYVEKSNQQIIRISDVKGNGTVETKNAFYISEKAKNNPKVDDFLLSPGDMLLSMSGSVGRIGIVPTSKNTLYLNQRVGKLFFYENLFYYYIKNLLLSGQFESLISNMGYGSVQQNINPNQIHSINIVIPKKEEITKYNLVAKAQDVKRNKNTDKIVLSEEARNMLLRRLVS